MELSEFADRLARLRLQKGVSARSMSLDIGQGSSYINNIENSVNYPSMSVFFNICEYLEITPQDFFDFSNNSPTDLQALIDAAKGLNKDQLQHLIAIAKDLK